MTIPAIFEDSPQYLETEPQIAEQGQPQTTFDRLLQMKSGPVYLEPSKESLIEQTQSSFQFLRQKLSASPPNVQEAVSIQSGIMHGNPVFEGTRIPLYQVIEELADGTSLEELGEGYPSLDKEHITAGLDFVASLLRIYDD